MSELHDYIAGYPFGDYPSGDYIARYPFGDYIAWCPPGKSIPCMMLVDKRFAIYDCMESICMCCYCIIASADPSGDRTNAISMIWFELVEKLRSNQIASRTTAWSNSC